MVRPTSIVIRWCSIHFGERTRTVTSDWLYFINRSLFCSIIKRHDINLAYFLKRFSPYYYCRSMLVTWKVKKHFFRKYHYVQRLYHQFGFQYQWSIINNSFQCSKAINSSVLWFVIVKILIKVKSCILGGD